MWDIKSIRTFIKPPNIYFHLNHVGYKDIEAIFEAVDTAGLSSEPCGI